MLSVRRYSRREREIPKRAADSIRVGAGVGEERYRERMQELEEKWYERGALP